jgi:putative glycosyl hydrolase-like family 15 (GHL15) protein
MLTRVTRAPCPPGTVAGGRLAAWARPRTFAAVVLASAGVAATLPGVGRASGAPVLRAHGHAIQWTRAGRHNRYKLLVRAPHIRKTVVVVGRSFTPPAVPGRTVVYRVKAAFNESAWSNPASITYRSEFQRERPEQEPAPREREAAPREQEPPPREQEPPPREEETHSEEVGKVKYRLDAASYYDRFATALYAPWAREHVSLIKAYPPFGDTYVSLLGLPVIGYHDPATEGQAPLGRSGIEAYVGKVNRDMLTGYTGVFIDDANWSQGFSPSPGPRANLANLIEAIDAAQPNALIEINSQYRDIWPLIKARDPDVARALKGVDQICVEFGVGPGSGISSTREYAEFMQYADTMHANGIHLTLAGDRFDNNVATMEYNLATYFLINDGGDYVSGKDQMPGHWWGGFDVDLGNAVGPRERLPGGVWTRRFTRGAAYTLEPGAATQTISLPRRMQSAEWGTSTSLTLAGGQGAVLVG